MSDPQDVLVKAAAVLRDGHEECTWEQGCLLKPVREGCHGTGRLYRFLLEECLGEWHHNAYRVSLFCPKHYHLGEPANQHCANCHTTIIGRAYTLPRTATEGLFLELAYDLLPKDGYVVMARGEAVLVGEATIHGDKRYAGEGDTPLKALADAVSKALEAEAGV